MISAWVQRRVREKGWSLEEAAARLRVEVPRLLSLLEEGQTDASMLRLLSERLGDPHAPPGIGEERAHLHEGDLVNVAGTRWGVAKVVELEDETARVRLFGGPGVKKDASVDVDRVEHIIVTPQTRCYLYDDTRDAWSVGRVKQYDDVAEHYVVDLPGKQFATVQSENLEVRSAEVQRAPTEVLVERGHETAFFYRHRSALTEALATQRALTRGLTGLTSSRVHLYEHQVEVARRVLSDPLPRYILADEVGLGKTIEAGIVARQHLLDDPDATVVIAVPRHLLTQWRHEWERKFAVRAHDPRVHIVPFGKFQEAPMPTMLVVDEAHHVGQAFAKEGTEVQVDFDELRRYAEAAETMLLLTATPSALAPEGLLSLLHLLDPLAYDLEERETFHARLQQQDDIAQALSALAPDDPAFLIEEGLSELEALFPDDADLAAFIDNTRGALAEEEPDDRDLAQALETVRRHVKETYRLFQRLLRHRRRDVEKGMVDRAEGTLHDEIGLDLREQDVTQALDAWREGALGAGATDDAYRRLFFLLFELGGTDLNLLSEAVQFRKDGMPPQTLQLTPEEASLLQLPHYDEEIARLDYLEDVAAAPVGEYDMEHTDVVADMAARHVQRGRRVVIFATRPEVAVQLCETVRASVEADASPADGEAFVGVLANADSAGAHTESEAFENAAAGALIVDRMGEEGLNLQFADVVVHHDLPFAPNRLEQRMGRLDRLGRAVPFDTHVVLPTADEDDLDQSPHYAWFRMVAEAFSLFDESVASLQFYFDEEMPGIRACLFQQGTRGLLDQIEKQRERASDELRRIRQQDLLTTLDIRSQQNQQLWDNLQAAEEEGPTLHRTVHKVLSRVWMLRGESGRQWTSYAATPKTMIPLDVQLDRFLPLYDQKVTANRTVSVESGGDVGLIRPGGSWVERLASFQEWDDRGQAYALWRRVPESDLALDDDLFWAFVFDILVEGDTDGVLASENENGGIHRRALQRRGDGLLAPKMVRVAVGQGGQVVARQALKDHLFRPFDREFDTNLHKQRVAVLDVLVSHGWAERCRSARQVALSHVSEQKDIQDAVDTAKRRLSFQRRRAKYQHARRQEQELSSGLDILHLIDGLEASITSPHFFVDAAGFIALSNRRLWETVSPDVIPDDLE